MKEQIIEGTMCKNCYGKGYSTELEGHATSGRGIVRKGGERINLCNCERGDNLRKYFDVKEEFIGTFGL